MELHSPFEDLEPYNGWLSCMVHKLWPKEWPRVKLGILLLITKMSNKGIKTFPIGMCDTTLENSFQGLQLCLWGLPNQNPYAKIINLWNSKIFNLAILNFFEGFPLGSLGIFLPLNVVPIAMYKYTIKEKMGIPPKCGPWWIVWMCLSWFCLYTILVSICINHLIY